MTLEEANEDKIKQLIRNISIAENMGLRVLKGVLVSYQGFTDKALNYAKSMAESGVKLYLLSRDNIKKIAKLGGS